MNEEKKEITIIENFDEIKAIKAIDGLAAKLSLSRAEHAAIMGDMKKLANNVSYYKEFYNNATNATNTTDEPEGE